MPQFCEEQGYHHLRERSHSSLAAQMSRLTLPMLSVRRGNPLPGNPPMVMTDLLSLPTELLEMIYHHLGSIDDVHHFGRVCTKTYYVIRRSSTYTEIMRSVIGSAPQHRHDIFLCDMLGLHQDFVKYFEEGSAPLRPTQIIDGESLHPFESRMMTAATKKCPFGPCNDCLPNDRVYDILARYQGIQVLEDEWPTRHLSCSDTVDLDRIRDKEELVRRYTCLVKCHEKFKDGEIASRSSYAKTYRKLNSDQKGRFYAALTSVWGLNELRWVLTHFTWPMAPFSFQLKILEMCKQSLEDQTRKLLVDEADRYAMWQFLYHHLLPHYGTFLADQDPSSEQPLTFPSNWTQSSTHSARMYQLFLTAGQTYLQPPDLIDLIMRFRTTRKRPYPHLTIPRSTKRYQCPLTTTIQARSLDRNAIGYLNLISHCTINQTEADPYTRFLVTPDPISLFPLTDESAAFFRNQLLGKFASDMRKSGPGEKLKDIKSVFNKHWAEVWWEVWWWANSEDKARAKMERWRTEDRAYT